MGSSVEAFYIISYLTSLFVNIFIRVAGYFILLLPFVIALIYSIKKKWVFTSIYSATIVCLYLLYFALNFFLYFLFPTPLSILSFVCCASVEVILLIPLVAIFYLIDDKIMKLTDELKE
jgi:hypothetical protein